MEPVFYFNPYDNRFIPSYHVPETLLTESQQELVRGKGGEPDNEYGHQGCYDLSRGDFPSIFYKDRSIMMHGHSVPIIVASLLCIPKGSRCSLEEMVHTEYFKKGRTIDCPYQADVHAAQMLVKDMKSFPLEPFYERLFQQSIPVTIDGRLSEQTGAVVEFNPHRMMFSAEAMKKHAGDIDWFTKVYLHEWYHVIELDLGTFVESTFKDHPRWRIERKQDSVFKALCYHRLPVDRKEYTALNTFNVAWECERREFNDGWPFEFAELLAALTYLKHPELVEKVRPLHAQLLRRKGYQRHLFLPHI